MARERVVSAQSEPPEAEAANHALRPLRMAEYVGQPRLRERLQIALEAVRSRKEPMEHVLLHGPPGLGKTTLAHVIANEMATRAHVTSGPALTRAGDLVGMLSRLEERDVLFIDEIHRLPAAVEEYIYPAMEDFRIDFTVESGQHARTVTLGVKPFTLIGATTRPGLLTHALRTRFGIAQHVSFYDQAELRAILGRAATMLEMSPPSGDALGVIAARSRGTPRVALRLLRRVRDFAEVRCGGRFDRNTVDEALALEGVDAMGLDELDRAYLRTLGTVYNGGPAGIEALAASMGEDGGTLEDVVEPFLLQIGFLARTRQGRCVTPAGASHCGVSCPAATADDSPDGTARLFES